MHIDGYRLLVYLENPVKKAFSGGQALANAGVVKEILRTLGLGVYRQVGRGGENQSPLNGADGYGYHVLMQRMP
ncbi:hypothetical protein D3C75_1208080 [compost metagenome]